MSSCTHILLDGVWMVEAEHSLTDDHRFQLSAASLRKMQGHKRYYFVRQLEYPDFKSGYSIKVFLYRALRDLFYCIY